jgi:hypothetical protein
MASKVSVEWFGDGFQDYMKAANAKCLSKVAISLLSIMKATVTGKGGFVGAGTRKHHTPSSPGNPPAVDTGHYRRSIQMDATGLSRPNPFVLVGSNVKYGPYLEFGTRNMQARPHWRPTLKKKGNKLIGLYMQCLTKEVNRFKGAK